MKSIIYIDNKIHGAIDQLVKYFSDGIFDINKHEVLFKFYPRSFFYYKKVLNEHNIRFKCYKKYSELDIISQYKIVYYLFNAQSNCKIVSYRNAKHIFITHGESHKISSIKPIIRIYDHIICSGQVSIDRYIQSGIFSIHDVDSKRLLMMGNTFIGQIKFYKDLSTETSSILYAPTWEGGVKEENYSSISEDLSSFQYIVDFAKISNISRVIVQPHPNTGHRDKRYKNYLRNGIDLLIQNNLQVGIFSDYQSKMSFISRIKNKFTKNLTLLNSNQKYGVLRAFVDISAMEVQLINKNIDVNVFMNDTINSMPSNPLLIEYYKNITVDFQNKHLSNNTINIKDYYISYSEPNIENLELKERLSWLEHYILK